MTLRLEELTSPAVAAAIARTPLAVVPFGSVEQHGPHLPCGTDTYAADAVAADLAERLGGLCVPFGPYGVTPLHRGRPGTVSLRPETFEALLTDVVSELAAGGVQTVVLVNWHEGNTASLNRVATSLQRELASLTVVVAQACYVAARLYEADGGKLTHGGSIETLAVLATRPELADLDAVEPIDRSARGTAVDEMRRSPEVYGFVTDVGEMAPEGWYGDPSWATPDRAADFAPTISEAIAERVTSILTLKQQISLEDA